MNVLTVQMICVWINSQYFVPTDQIAALTGRVGDRVRLYVGDYCLNSVIFCVCVIMIKMKNNDEDNLIYTMHNS